jgi:hypothetical protein
MELLRTRCYSWPDRRTYGIAAGTTRVTHLFLILLPPGGGGSGEGVKRQRFLPSKFTPAGGWPTNRPIVSVSDILERDVWAFHRRRVFLSGTATTREPASTCQDLRRRCRSGDFSSCIGRRSCSAGSSLGPSSCQWHCVLFWFDPCVQDQFDPCKANQVGI